MRDADIGYTSLIYFQNKSYRQSRYNTKESSKKSHDFYSSKLSGFIRIFSKEINLQLKNFIYEVILFLFLN